MHHDDIVLVRDMIDAIDEIDEFTHDISYENLMDDRKLQYALVRLLEIIGEAANQISESFKEKETDIPWRKMIALRHRLSHGYFSINMKIVWDTIKNDLPPVRISLSEILNQDHSSS